MAAEATSASDNEKTRGKIVIVGDGMVGKTRFLMTYAGQEYEDYKPTVFDAFEMTPFEAEQAKTLEIVDTGGQEEFENLRLLAYPKSDIVIICFSLVLKSSFNNVEMWVKETLVKEPKAKLILVGTKLDLREEKLQTEPKNVTTSREGKRKAKMLGKSEDGKPIKAKFYFECSALTKEGLDDIFVAAIEEIFYPTKPSPCAIL